MKRFMTILSAAAASALLSLPALAQINHDSDQDLGMQDEMNIDNSNQASDLDEQMPPVNSEQALDNSDQSLSDENEVMNQTPDELGQQASGAYDRNSDVEQEFVDQANRGNTSTEGQTQTGQPENSDIN